ncbi:phosphoglucosamine mutase [Kiritimatiellota bacterium B12222]|nr:phosphoglucosamine mutase [Kiritimatiellota bacterium B12222]
MARLFGTDGVRGIANVGSMTAENVLEIGRATAQVCLSQQHVSKTARRRIVIGKDTRASGYMLENALSAGICSMGVDVLLLGPLPTPGIAFTTMSMRADAGLVLSASHNPYEDNGIKIFGGDGFKIPDEMENEIQALIESGKVKEARPTSNEVGRAKRIDDAIGRYIVFCKNTFPQDFSLEGLRIVLDCANGATYKVAPIIFEELGAEVFAIHHQPNGININDNCGSQHTDDLIEKVKETRADIGLAFDGDGDRLIAVDERGNELTGDHIIAIIAQHMQEEGRLKNNRVITTVMSNFGFVKAMEKLGIEQGQSDVGDRYVLKKMLETDSILGGEASGHLICRDFHTTGDGIIAALQLLRAMQGKKKKLSSLSQVMTLFPQKLINVNVTDKPPLEEVKSIQQAIDTATGTLKDQGRVLVRYSGTQSMCRVMVEGPTVAMTNSLASDIAQVVSKSLGGI